MAVPLGGGGMGAEWTTVYTRATAFDSLRMPFGGRRPARFVRVSEPTHVSNRPAMCELEFYAAPPPAGVATILR